MNKKILFVLAAIFIAQIVLAVGVYQADARTLWDLQEGLGKSGGTGEIGRAFGETGARPADIRDVVINLIKIFLTFTGIILIILIIIAGYKWMTAGGSADKVHEAQSQIKAALIGITIVLAAYTITNFVAHCVLDVLSNSYWMCRTP